MSSLPNRGKSERSLSTSKPTDPESQTSDPTTDAEEPGEDNDADLPITMAASVVLTGLPRDAHEALEGAGDLGIEKGKQSLLPSFIKHPLHVYVYLGCPPADIPVQ